MMNNNKILTVSYGTFSCTLEGFDDSFDTMKAIAEYFRDLAADDRYFGAEPPQPDAEMLAKIAEREVARRVEAHEHEGRIMLKAHEEPLSATPVVDAADSVQEATSQRAVPKEAPVEADNAAAEEDVEVEPVAAQSEPEKETLTATPEAEIAEVKAVSTESAVPEESAEIEEIAQASEELVQPDDQQNVADNTTEVFASEETDVSGSVETPLEEEVYASDIQEDAAAFFAQGVEAVAEDDSLDDMIATEKTAREAEEFQVEDVATEETNMAASLADKLERIRAVVSSQETQDADGYEEDTEEASEAYGFADIDAFAVATDADAPEDNDVVAQAAQDISEAFAVDDALEDASPIDAQQDVRDEEDELDAVLRRVTGSAPDEAIGAEIDLAGEDADDDSAEDGRAGNLFSSDETAEDDVEDDIHGRMVKVDRADLEAVLASGELEEYDDEVLAGEALLSDDEEAELQRDLAALEEDSLEAAEVEETHHAAREKLPEIDADAGEDVSRLMAEADQQMQEPEGKTRRSAFAHLRAAVAARFADRSMVDADKQVEEAKEAYRNDLAEAVKPRRPSMPVRSENHEDARPAPLKLVAEQRITEQAQPSTRGPVAPRRVEAEDAADDSETEGAGFALYAEERGAESLPELLEAAAAYLSFVEGHEQFSRPQLMSRVRQAHQEEFTREDGLRSFGQLLRTGKIEKIKGGRFTAAEGIDFKPDHRAAG